MRIAQITYSYQPILGGADVWAHLLRRVCEEAGHEVSVYQRPAQGVDDSAVHPVYSPVARLLGTRGEFWTLPFGLPALRDELAQHDVLVVHYPNYHRFVEWHPRTVLVSHGVFWDDRPNALRSKIKRKLARRAYRNATAVVANDTFFLREVGEDVQPGIEPFSEVSPGRSFVPNCLDTEQFSRREPHPKLTAWPVILTPRNLYRNRGVHLAIEAFGSCAGALNEARLVVVGGAGDPGYIARCKGLARTLGIDARVVFFGPVPWREMPAVYSAAQLTIIPTLCGEGTSLAALESMSCGIATVSTNVAGLADLPTVQCDPTPEALGEALLSAWRERDRIGREQMATVRSVYNLDNWAQAWIRILEQM